MPSDNQPVFQGIASRPSRCRWRRSRDWGRSWIVGLALLGFGIPEQAPLLAAEESERATETSVKPGRRSLRPHIVVATVSPEDENSRQVRHGITRRDLEFITTTLPDAPLIVPSRRITRYVRFGDWPTVAPIIGTVPEYSELHPLPISRGRMLNADDVEQIRNVAVVGETIADSLFYGRDPIGKNVRVGGHYFLIIGTIGVPLSKVAADEDPRSHIYLPISTMRARFGDLETTLLQGKFLVGNFELSRIEVVLQRASDAKETASVLERLLSRVHEDGSFSVTTPVSKWIWSP